MASYRYYMDINGNEHYFEWNGASDGGVVFDMCDGNIHIPVLAYDLTKISNPSVDSMYFSYWGQNMGTVYRESSNSVYIVYSNQTEGDNNNPRGYDVRLTVTSSHWSDICQAIREYWDSLLKTLIYEANGTSRPGAYGYTTKVFTKFGYLEPTLQNCYMVSRNTRVSSNMTMAAAACYIFDGNVVDQIQAGLPSSGNTCWGVSADGTWQWGHRYSELQYYSAYDVTAYSPNDSGAAADAVKGTIADYSITQSNAYWVEEPDAIFGDWLQHAREYFDGLKAPPIYVGVNGKARQVTDMYVGVNGKARKVKAIYVGVNGKAREVFKAT